MKQILIIKGVSNTGKTTKINEIANWIINTYGASNTIGLDPLDMGKNIFGILTVKNLKIGINSAGDDLASVQKIERIQNECDIIIGCCRTKGETFQFYYKNYTRGKGWMDIYFNSDEFPAADLINQKLRDDLIIDGLKCCLIGLEKP